MPPLQSELLLQRNTGRHCEPLSTAPPCNVAWAVRLCLLAVPRPTPSPIADERGDCQKDRCHYRDPATSGEARPPATAVFGRFLGHAARKRCLLMLWWDRQRLGRCDC